MAEMKSLAVRQDELEVVIDDRMPKLSELVPDAADLVRMKRAFLMSCANNPKLYECSNASLMGALVETIQLGLMPGASQEAAIVPFWNSRNKRTEAVFIPMYQGLLKLIYRGGQVAWVKCEVVRTNDEFKYVEESDRTLFAHMPAEEDPGDLRAVWMKVKTRQDDTPMFGFMWKRSVLEHRERSKAWQSQKEHSPWGTDPEAMWKKTIVRVYSKFLPKSEDGALSRAMHLDEQAERGEPQGLSTGRDEDLIPEEEPVDHSGSPLLGESAQGPLLKHLFAFAGRLLADGEDNHGILHEVIEPMGYASLKDVPISRVDEIKAALQARVPEAEVS